MLICLVIKILSGVNLISSYLACQLLQIVQLHLKIQLAMNRYYAQDNYLHNIYIHIRLNVLCFFVPTSFIIKIIKKNYEHKYKKKI